MKATPRKADPYLYQYLARAAKKEREAETRELARTDRPHLPDKCWMKNFHLVATRAGSASPIPCSASLKPRTRGVPFPHACSVLRCCRPGTHVSQSENLLTSKTKGRRSQRYKNGGTSRSLQASLSFSPSHLVRQPLIQSQIDTTPFYFSRSPLSLAIHTAASFVN
ncbi:hypothetical protein DL89DRAFT_52642 [Linderina pennispora]|uniref:Uncharacterized protein n=1 Tax=Linderina pennispora TaxID=61395 RepID=A0A1Y1W0W8_9FUNG|nr:uncharacterized protein DL89DRAFT_52642 [Linderina pennispora]ORX67138.1 hypothetical protein DL89DRAFT_52642 [Linderina pennispora]